MAKRALEEAFRSLKAGSILQTDEQYLKVLKAIDTASELGLSERDINNAFDEARGESRVNERFLDD